MLRRRYQGSWSQPGLYGLLTPFLPAGSAGLDAPDADFFWGPSVHWNTAVQSWVMLLNHANGSYNTKSDYFAVSYASSDLSNPMRSWSTPERLLTRTWPGMSMYPEVMGLQQGETDQTMGSPARFFIRGWSRWEAVFENVPVRDEEPAARDA